MGVRRVQDATPVQAHQPPRAVTVEDSFKSCTSLDAAATVLGVLAPDLLFRLWEELQVGPCMFPQGVQELESWVGSVGHAALPELVSALQMCCMRCRGDAW